MPDHPKPTSDFSQLGPQWLPLMQAYVDQTITAESLAVLESILREHATARQILIDLLALDSALQSEHALQSEREPQSAASLESQQSIRAEAAIAGQAHSSSPSANTSEAVNAFTANRSFSKPQPMVRRSRAVTRSLAMLIVATAASLSVWIGWHRWSTPSEATSTKAVWFEVLEVNDLKLSSALPAWGVGERLQKSELKIDAGELDVRLDSGVTLSLEGPFHAQFQNSGAMRLFHGTMSAEVAEKGKGFTVLTATSEVVDLGTRFGISAKADGETDVVVFEGEVKLRRNNSPTKAEKWTTLKSGEAVRVAKQKEMQRLARVRLSKNKKLWSTQSSIPTSLVIDVEDNATEPEFLNYLGVVPQGMGADSQPYSDRPNVRWQAMPGGTFPSELESIDLIRTFLADRGDRDLEIRIRISRPCTLYVIIDNRQTPPQWLEREFLKTDLQVRVGPWPATAYKDVTPDSDGKTYIPCTIWKCRIDRTGEVVLGSPFVKGFKGTNLMYGIAVAAADKKFNDSF